MTNSTKGTLFVLKTKVSAHRNELAKTFVVTIDGEDLLIDHDTKMFYMPNDEEIDQHLSDALLHAVTMDEILSEESNKLDVACDECGSRHHYIEIDRNRFSCGTADPSKIIKFLGEAVMRLG